MGALLKIIWPILCVALCCSRASHRFAPNSTEAPSDRQNRPAPKMASEPVPTGLSVPDPKDSARIREALGDEVVRQVAGTNAIQIASLQVIGALQAAGQTFKSPESITGYPIDRDDGTLAAED